MSTGVVTDVTPVRSGGTLTTDVTATDTVLPIDDAVDFAETFEEPRWLVIGAETTPRQYIAVENDESAQQSVTLVFAVGTDYEAGLPVTPWDPNATPDDKRAVEYEASVLLDDQNTTVPARLRHAALPTAGTSLLVGATVEIGEDEDGDWEVSDVLGREAQVSPSTVASPFCVGSLASDFSVPNDVRTTVVGWTFFQRDFGTNVLTPGVFYARRAGRYLITIGLRWKSNSTGRREGLSRRHTTLGVFDNFVDSREASPTAAMSTQAVSSAFLAVGDAVSFQAYQNSGAALDLFGSAQTMFSITWIGPSSS